MADQVADVKSRVDIVSVVGTRVSLKKAGKYHKGVCPFHAERTPSFFVSEELQIFKCFGCGKSGDVFTFLQEYEGMVFREVLEDLAEKVGVKLERHSMTGHEKEKVRIFELLDLAKEYYRWVLVKHKAGEGARKYLVDRGVDEAVVERFELGFAPESWDGLMKFLKTWMI